MSNSMKDAMLLAMKERTGHEPLEPANQYCKHCNAALFCNEVNMPCVGHYEQPVQQSESTTSCKCRTHKKLDNSETSS